MAAVRESGDLIAILRFYVERMLKEVPGMKVLLLDSETTKIVSTVYSQSDILEQEVYLVEKLDVDEADQLLHLKAVCFLRPTRENIARLRRELRDPRFGEYHLFFTNRLDDMRIQDLAEMDVKETVQQVQEYFGDYIALEGHHFVVPLQRPHLAFQPFSWDYGNSSDAISRITEGVASMMLSLRRRFQIRYQRGSEICEKLAQSLYHLTSVEERELFDFGMRGGEAEPVLLLIDRRDDPVTPLLSQWTYQAMLHELLGSINNRVDLRHVPGIKKDFEEVVLQAHQDPFFKQIMYANFGDVGMAIKGLVDDWSRESKQGKDFQSIEDMANFIDNLSDYNHNQGVTYKHVTLMSELSRIVEQRQLMQISSTEQDLVCQAPSLASHYEEVSALVGSLAVDEADKLRLVLLFALRYERDGKPQVMALLKQLQDSGVDSAKLGVIRTVLKYCPGDKRVMDLFSDRYTQKGRRPPHKQKSALGPSFSSVKLLVRSKVPNCCRSISSRFASLAKQHIRGVENVYTQHTPPLVAMLEKLAKGRIAETEYSRVSSNRSPSATKPPKLVLVFIIGGTTYEEAKAVSELNTAGEKGEGWSAGMRFILGGTGVQNSGSFLKDFQELMLNERYQG